MDEASEPLTGGNTSGAVVRVGTTVRKPWTRATPGVVELMTAVRAAGVDVPEPLGRDESGRRIVEYVPGRLALHAPPLHPEGLRRVGALVRSIHDASEGFRPSGDVQWAAAIPAPGDDLICHGDLAPWNLVVGDRWVFIDWDAAGPSTRLWDLAYAAQAFTLQDPQQRPDAAALRLAALVDGYGADDGLRDRLPCTMAERAEAMHELLRSSHRSGRQPWAALHADGHGAHWRSVAAYTEEHRDVWARALTAGR